jgi:hypothetical protein
MLLRLICGHHFWGKYGVRSARLHFSIQIKGVRLVAICLFCGVGLMNQLLFAILIATCLSLTAYFGHAAWRANEDVVDRVPPLEIYGWRPARNE